MFDTKVTSYEDLKVLGEYTKYSSPTINYKDFLLKNINKDVDITLKKRLSSSRAFTLPPCLEKLTPEEFEELRKEELKENGLRYSIEERTSDDNTLINNMLQTSFDNENKSGKILQDEVIDKAVKEIYTSCKNNKDILKSLATESILREDNGFINFFKKIFNAIVDLAKTIYNAIKKIIEAIFNVLKEFWKIIWDAVKKTLKGLIDFVIKPIAYAINWVITTGLQPASDWIGNILSTSINFIGNCIQAVLTVLGDGIDVVVGFISDIILKFLKDFKDMFIKIFPQFKMFFDVMASVFDPLFWKELMSAFGAGLIIYWITTTMITISLQLYNLPGVGWGDIRYFGKSLARSALSSASINTFNR